MARPTLAPRLYDLLQHVPTREAFAVELLDELCRLVGADRAVFADYAGLPSLDTLSITSAAGAPLASYGFNPVEYARFQEVQRHIPVALHDFERIHADLRRTGACVDTDTFSLKERRTLPFYREIMAPQGVRSNLGLWIPFRGRPLGLVRFDRLGGRGALFHERDVERLRPLLPQLGTVWAAAAHLPPHADRAGELTAREREVASLVARGLTNAEIGRLLGTSPFTVRNQLSRILARLGVANRAELVAVLRGG